MKNRHETDLSKVEKAEIVNIIYGSLTVVLQAISKKYKICPMCFADMVITVAVDLQETMQKARDEREAAQCPPPEGSTIN
jgi:hypothetical protein